MINLRQLPLALALTAAFVLPAQAQSLVELYDAARGFDANYQSAKSLYEANLSKADQAKAGLLPSIGLSAGVNRANIDNSLAAQERSFGSHCTVRSTRPAPNKAKRALTWRKPSFWRQTRT
jgi:outer membrane protein